MQYTIEARELTSEYNHRPKLGGEARRTQVEAMNANEAIAWFVEQNASELVSLSTPARGRESIATVKKDDSVFLVRIYAG